MIAKSEKSKFNQWPFITVIVSVYNGAKHIEGLLKSLLILDYPHGQHEIIIVNNNSTDNTVSVVEQYQIKFNGRLKIIHENKKGSSHARNRGLVEAKGEIISFTDDDCVVDQQWMKEIATTFNENNADAVQGKIVLCTKIPENTFVSKQFIKDRFAHVDYGPDVFKMDKENLVGANMHFRRDVFDRYGNFNPNFQMNDDTELSHRVKMGGGQRFYNPKLIIYHYYATDRITEKRLLRQTYYFGMSAILLEPQGISSLRHLLYCLKNLGIYYIQYLKLKIKGEKENTFMAKVKVYGNLGRCRQLLSVIISRNHMDINKGV